MGLGALAALSAGTNVLNTYMQYRENQYQHGIQHEIFDREDNAIRRRVADLKAAGLSPVLAAGQGASAGSVVSTKAPQLDSSMAIDAMNMMTQEANIATTESQKKLIDQQVEKAKADTVQSKIDGAIKQHDLNIFKQSGTASNASAIGKIGRDIVGALDSGFVTGVKEKIDAKIKGVVNNPGLIQKFIDMQQNRIDKYNNKGGK